MTSISKIEREAHSFQKLNTILDTLVMGFLIFLRIFKKVLNKWNTFQIGWPYWMRSANHPSPSLFLQLFVRMNHSMMVISFYSGKRAQSCWLCIFSLLLERFDLIKVIAFTIKSARLETILTLWVKLISTFIQYFCISDFCWQIIVLVQFILTQIYYTSLNTMNCC